MEIRNIYSTTDAIFVGLNGAEQDTLHNLNGDVWFSTDKGDSWELLTGDLTNSNIFGLNAIAHDNENRLLVGTYGGGVFRTNSAILSNGEFSANKEIKVYPNPAIESLQLILPDDYTNQGYRIEVYNALGVLVYDNANVVNINASQFAEGVYTLVVTTSSSRSTTGFVIR
ncbi:MAG: T9SS type A sorting domain-containing protein [Crocinitomicaceae bacterium]|nr:T9SS type A sorting domain-containing protein [Crocinitomicaceae bacterium]